MRLILQLLAQYQVFDIVVFSDNVILNVPIEQWPPCDALLSYHSGKFPIDKVVQYQRLHNPVSINDLEMGRAILSRVETYSLLIGCGVPVVRHFVVDHNDPEQEAKFEEHEDHIVVNGQVLRKPFVEKPVSSI